VYSGHCLCVWSDVVKHFSHGTSKVDGDVIGNMSQESVVFVNIGRLTAGDTFVSLYVTIVSVNVMFVCVSRLLVYSVVQKKRGHSTFSQIFRKLLKVSK